MPKPSLKYLQLLSEKYPTIQAASTAIINYSAQLQLPKGTEHFLSDVHGEHEAFNHTSSATAPARSGDRSKCSVTRCPNRSVAFSRR